MKKKKGRGFCREKFWRARVIMILALVFALSQYGWKDARPKFVDVF